MNKILELRQKRNTLWEKTKNFLEEHRDENGMVPKEALEQYDKMTFGLPERICYELRHEQLSKRIRDGF